MLKDRLIWVRCADDLETELMQSHDEGKDVRQLEESAMAVLAMDLDDPNRESNAAALFDTLEVMAPSPKAAWPDEPSSLEAIQAARPADRPTGGFDLATQNPEEVYDKIYGAWLGRCAGCLLGKPVEGWQRGRLLGFLKATDNYPIKRYMASDVAPELRAKYEIPDDFRAWINEIEHAPEDDDTNYTVIGLRILEKYGADFAPIDVAEAWLDHLSILHVCTAERVAYRNLIAWIMPPRSASYHNPYREWIGAQIRADFFGYIAPGDPERAADYAWRDASISHVKNGIYGEMFVAAMLAGAAVSRDIEEVIRYGLSQIPEKCRLADAVAQVLEWKNKKQDFEEAIAHVHRQYDEKMPHHWCHTISNAMIVCIGLLWGRQDFEKSIGMAVSAGFDTDCNGATVGSIVGMMLGARALPESWTAPLNDKLHSGVDGMGLVKISELAERTAKVMKDCMKKA